MTPNMGTWVVNPRAAVLVRLKELGSVEELMRAAALLRGILCPIWPTASRIFLALLPSTSFPCAHLQDCSSCLIFSDNASFALAKNRLHDNTTMILLDRGGFFTRAVGALLLTVKLLCLQFV